MSGNTDRGKVMRNRFPAKSSRPVEGALFVDPDITDEENAKKHKHGDKGECSHVRGEPGTVENGPGKKENGLNVENDKEHGDHVKARGIAAAGVAIGGNAASIRKKLSGTAAGFRTDQLEDEKSHNGKGKNEYSKNQNRNVGGGHGLRPERMLAHKGRRSARRAVTGLLFEQEFARALRSFYHGFD